jgi:protein-ribulosamine 3-kinase
MNESAGRLRAAPHEDVHRATRALADRGLSLDPAGARAVGGGCIHSAWRLAGPGGPVFLKTNRSAAAWLLAAEAEGLEALRSAGFLRVPGVIAQGVSGPTAWLALEWLELRSPDAGAQHALGEALARQHLATGRRFGWPTDNAIGASLQPNGEHDDWARFFAARRLGYQLALGESCGLPGRLLARGRRLQARVPELLRDRNVAPALLHGDLWGGNWAAEQGGGPVVFDPAVHFGDPECDLAMTRLFGGFGPEFYAAYDATLPPAAGRELRERLYQLYHVLNHANLFGGGYTAQAQRLVDGLLAELG